MKEKTKRVMSFTFLFSLTFLILSVLLPFLNHTINSSNAYVIDTHQTFVAKGTDYDWIILHYFDGDNNLEAAAINDIYELERGLSNSNILILVLLDRIPGYDSSNDGWTGTRLYQIEEDSTNAIDSTVIEDFGELNMGDGATLQLFLDYVFETFIGNNYWLNLWDHGGGIDGICWDNTSEGDYLTMDEMQQAIESSTSLYSKHFDIISLDACYMNMIEVAYELKDYADYFVASEESIPNNGFDYENITAQLSANPSMTGEELSRVIVDTYKSFYDDVTSYVTLSALDLSIMDDFVQNTNYFVDNLTNVLLSNLGEIIDDTFINTLSFYDSYVIDYKHFVELLQENTSLMVAYPLLQNSITDLLASFEDLIIANYQHSCYFGVAYGVTVFMPTNTSIYSSYIDDYIAITGRFANMDWQADTFWDEFLETFYGLGYGAIKIRTIELNQYLSNQMLQAGDSHYYELTIATTGVYEFNVSISSGDVDIFLFNQYSPTVIAYSLFYNPDDAETEKIITHLYPGLHYIQVLAWDESVYDLVVTQINPIVIAINDTVNSYFDGSQQGIDYHYMQTLNDYYQLNADFIGYYTFTLTYNSYVVNVDLYLLNANYLLIDYPEDSGNVYEVTIEVTTSSTYIVCISSYSGRGSYTLTVTFSSIAPSTSSSTLNSFTISLSIFVLLAVGSFTFNFTRRKIHY